MYRLIIIFVSLAMIFSCSNTTESEDNFIQIKTDNEAYIADTSTVIYLDVSNEGQEAVYYLCKTGLTLNEYEGDILTNSWAFDERALCYKPESIEPNSSHTFDVGFFEWKNFPDAKFDATVKYKFKIELYKDNKLKNVVDSEKQVSNFFKITKK
jgi:hypothetical protein